MPINFVIGEQGTGRFAQGQPDLFVDDNTFESIVENRNNVARRIYEFYRKSICIGILGKEVNGVYVESTNVDTFETDALNGGVGYYGEV